MPDQATDAPRGEARRAQILAAAAECFRLHGFHGSSIAQISRLAGMSAGHIYHYFENKEAIIAGIVAQDLDRLLTLTSELRSAVDVRSAMVDCAAEGVENNLEPGAAALQLEIVAEAARNAGVAEIVRAADRQCRAGLAETLRTMRTAAGHVDSDATIAGMVEALAAMFEGLQIRTIRNPELDREAVTQTFRQMVHDLLTRAPSRDT